MKSSPTANGRYSPLGEAHARVKAEMNAKKEGATGKEVKDSALEATDKKQAAAPPAAKVPIMPVPAEAQAQTTPRRPIRTAHGGDRRTFIVHGMGPDGDEIHTLWRRMRAVRHQDQTAATQKTDSTTSADKAPLDRRAHLRAAAEKLFKPKVAKTDQAEAKSEGKDAAEEIET